MANGHGDERMVNDHKDTLRRLQKDVQELNNKFTEKTHRLELAMTMLADNVNAFIKATDERLKRGSKRFTQGDELHRALNKKLLLVTVFLALMMITSDHASQWVKYILGIL